jgi:hypothetical protein
MGKRQPRGNDERGWLFLMPVEIYKDKKKTTMKDFDDWLSECPVPYEQTCNGLNTTEYYSFDLIDCEMEDDND